MGRYALLWPLACRFRFAADLSVRRLELRTPPSQAMQSRRAVRAAALSCACRLHPLVGALVIDECRAGPAEPHRYDADKHHVVGCDRLDLDHPAVARNHRIDENRRTCHQFAPASGVETLGHRALAASRKHIRERIVAGAQRVDAEHAIGVEDRRRLAAPVDANEQRRRLIRDRATAVAVKPALPAGPAVVTTCTAAPSWLIASRNCAASTVWMCSAPTASNEPIIASSGRWSNQLM